MENKSGTLKDPSLWVLLGSNLVMLFLALTQGWSIRSIVFIFWLQSLIIGFFSFLRILSLKNDFFSYLLNNALIENILRILSLKNNFFSYISKDPLMKNVIFQKIYLAFFFVMHYGLFCLFTLILAMIVTRTDKWILIAPEMGNIMLMGGIFFINHLFSFIYDNFQEGRRDEFNVAAFLFPYVRIAPLIFMFFITPLALALHPIDGLEKIVLVLFMLLKTLFDMAAHNLQHRPSSNKAQEALFFWQDHYK